MKKLAIGQIRLIAQNLGYCETLTHLQTVTRSARTNQEPKTAGLWPDWDEMPDLITGPVSPVSEVSENPSA